MLLLVKFEENLVAHSLVVAAGGELDVHLHLVALLVSAVAEEFQALALECSEELLRVRQTGGACLIPLHYDVLSLPRLSRGLCPACLCRLHYCDRYFLNHNANS